MPIPILRTLVLLSCLGFLFLVSFVEPAVEAWEPPEVQFPEDNPVSAASVDFGSNLFFETLLSRDSTISCQSCHLITDAFADHLPVGMGVDDRTVTRNTPSLFNIGLHPTLMKDGKFATLEEQVLGPINDHREFDLSPEQVVERIASQPSYQEQSMAAYGEPVSMATIQKALANFQRIIVSNDTPFDAYMRGDEAAISDAAKAGWKLFQSERLNCRACHSGFDFSDYSFQSNGYFDAYPDSGRAIITRKPEDVAKFKIPSLRNVATTWPYMHNGSVASLCEVLQTYAKGGSGHANQSERIRKFELSKEEEDQVMAFLEGLTEQRFLEEDE